MFFPRSAKISGILLEVIHVYLTVESDIRLSLRITHKLSLSFVNRVTNPF